MSNVKHTRQYGKGQPLHVIEMQYQDFRVDVCEAPDGFTHRTFDPTKRNYFASWFFYGECKDYRTDNDEYIRTWSGFDNAPVPLPYSFYEVYAAPSKWLCFSSYKPYTATHINGGQVHAGQLAYNVNTLDYIEGPCSVTGDHIVLTYGQWCNKPVE